MEILSHEVSEALKIGQQINPLEPVAHVHTAGNLSAEVRKISPSSGSVGFGNTSVRFDIPKVGSLGEMWLELTAADPSSGNYTEASGLNFIESVEIYSGSHLVVPRLQYDDVMNYILNTLPHRKRKDLLTLASDAAGGTPVYVPVWTPWSAYLNNANLAPLPVCHMNEELHVVINFRAGADCLASGASGAGALTGTFYCQIFHSKMKPNASWVQKSIGFKVGPSTTLASATEQNVLISHLQGTHLNTLFALNRATADLTANLRYRLQEVTSAKWNVDSNLVDQHESSLQSKILNLHFRDMDLHDGDILSGGSDEPVFWTIGGKLSHKHVFGSMVISNGRHVSTDIISSAASSVRMVGVTHSTYVLKNGGLRKVDH